MGHHRRHLFISAGGYHHHLGFNTWKSAGGGPCNPKLCTNGEINSSPGTGTGPSLNTGTTSQP